jgi:HAE1 family hydrophobic/amphiphilic exporter-1
VLTSREAVALALEHTLQLRADRLGPEIAALAERSAETSWTPSLFSRLFNVSSQTPSTSSFDAAVNQLSADRFGSEVGIAQRLPWGASYRVSWDGTRQSSNSAFVRFDPELQATATATIVQPLLRGLRSDDARSERETARRVRERASLALSAQAMATQRDVLRAYWGWTFARDLLVVHRQSLTMAQTLLNGNRRRVETGAMAAVDVIEAEAEVARRQEAILIAEKNVSNAEDVVRLLVFGDDDPRRSDPLSPQVADDNDKPSGDLIARAMAEREDLRILRKDLELQDVTIRRLRDESLPEANLQVDYARQATGGPEARALTSALTTPATFGSVLNELWRGTYPTWSVQLAVSYPIGLARGEADRARASLQREQQEANLKAAEQRVATEVKAAVREFDTGRRRLETTRATVGLAERRLDAEERKFAAGLSTSFFVFQAQRDLSQARETELAAIRDARLAAADLEAVVRIPLVGR